MEQLIILILIVIVLAFDYVVNRVALGLDNKRSIVIIVIEVITVGIIYMYNNPVL